MVSHASVSQFGSTSAQVFLMHCTAQEQSAHDGLLHTFFSHVANSVSGCKPTITLPDTSLNPAAHVLHEVSPGLQRLQLTSTSEHIFFRHCTHFGCVPS